MTDNIQNGEGVGLLPCPFCGDKPRIRKWHGGPPTKVMIHCQNDECDVSPQVVGDTPTIAADRWNTRHSLARDPATADVERVAVETLIEPWKDHNGPLPDFDSPVACVFDSGVQYAVELLAKELGVTDWTPCDGTEEYDGDLGGTMMNIVREALPLNQDGERMWPSEVTAALSRAAPSSGQSDKMLGELLAVIHRDGGQYQDQHGTEKAVADAMTLSAERLASISGEAMAIVRGMYEVMTGDCGVDPCVGSMAPAEDLCGRAKRLLSAPSSGQEGVGREALAAELGEQFAIAKYSQCLLAADAVLAVFAAAARSSEPAIAEGERVKSIDATAMVSKALGDHQVGNRPSLKKRLIADIRAAVAQSSTPPASKGVERLALEAIKAVTATTKDGPAGLSRIMSIARAAGVEAPYSELLKDPRVALIVERPRPEWMHLFGPVCAIPPEGWRCTRKPGHDGPCAAVAAASPTPSNDTLQGRGEVEDRIWFGYQRRLSLSFYSPMYGDDDDQSEEWRVTQESGPINDREWDVVGRGQTVDEAISAARAALQKDTRHDG